MNYVFCGTSKRFWIKAFKPIDVHLEIKLKKFDKSRNEINPSKIILSTSCKLQLNIMSVGYFSSYEMLNKINFFTIRSKLKYSSISKVLCSFSAVDDHEMYIASFWGLIKSFECIKSDKYLTSLTCRYKSNFKLVTYILISALTIN